MEETHVHNDALLDLDTHTDTHTDMDRDTHGDIQSERHRQIQRGQIVLISYKNNNNKNT